MREYDAVIFGASGFTGQYIAVEWAKTAAPGSRWALAGRSQAKLESTRAHVQAATGSTEAIPIVIADVFDGPAMAAMAASTRLVVNCTGPFRLFGEPVVRACVEAGTHYVDITGEPQFIETMALRYDATAKQNNALVVHSCGFDSIPADMGTVFVTNQFPSGGACASVEAFISMHGKRGHATTYECIVRGLAAADDLKSLRQANAIKVPYFGPRLTLRNVGYDPRVQKYILKFLGADASVVRATQKHLVASDAPTPPTQFAVYATFASAFSFVPLVLSGLALYVLGRFEAGRRLLIAHPGWFTFGYFTHAGPSADEMAHSGFSHRFFAKGYKDKATIHASPDWEVVARVDGPEPGYVATSSMVVSAARVVLDGEVPITGGVLTPGAAFRSTSLIERLQARGINFTLEKSQSLVA
ncbi:saccharopine dehydrogenase [Saprolegnia parasitica CBS 223.65]|uniref:Saccharopine dehydrogenase n=1 Tax=Saprolegnia parasitica (strain CBS 223.65) TaxID=695850 RepID=A0A067CXA0_SAPPC|nr:saccharopine dehydrogenase [Saprolegnia parasitica CBS 223.65]KDO33885.1 saccharopine dehydrogenase [Saprolegnia parasitica CBS 223.65]|eukprot:XP_012195521.1 saccharopine dehydrogenase [Saprolegnia parasitica CBS 223.65]